MRNQSSKNRGQGRSTTAKRRTQSSTGSQGRGQNRGSRHPMNDYYYDDSGVSNESQNYPESNRSWRNQSSGRNQGDYNYNENYNRGWDESEGRSSRNQRDWDQQGGRNEYGSSNYGEGRRSGTNRGEYGYSENYGQNRNEYPERGYDRDEQEQSEWQNRGGSRGRNYGSQNYGSQNYGSQNQGGSYQGNRNDYDYNEDFQDEYNEDYSGSQGRDFENRNRGNQNFNNSNNYGQRNRNNQYDEDYAGMDEDNYGHNRGGRW